MRHTLPQWLDLDRRTTGLQQVPILLQLGPMNLHPGFNQALLAFGNPPPRKSSVSIAKTAA
jgi:hypothetical protein